MTIVRRPSPLGELMSLRSAMDRLFEDSVVRRPFGTGFETASSLPLDVTRTSDALVVEAALPGIKPDDVEITVEDGTLSIRGEYREERGKGEGENLVSEIRRGSVSRALTLPTGLEPDKATATFEHGVLTLRIPKAESVKPRQIRISPTIDGTSTETRASGSTESQPIAGTGNGSRPEPAMAGQKG
jgi:HSP20 family protein